MAAPECGFGQQGAEALRLVVCAVDGTAVAGWCRYLLVRRSLKAGGELTAYLVFAPSQTELATLVSVAGRRWCIEMCFEAAKGEVGLDEYEVRSWTGWYRHVTLSMWALVLLSVVRAAQVEVPGEKRFSASSLSGFKASRGLVSPPCQARGKR